MNKTVAILSIIVAILCFDCISMHYRIKAQDLIIESQKDELQREREAFRIHLRRCNCDSLCECRADIPL